MLQGECYPPNQQMRHSRSLISNLENGDTKIDLFYLISQMYTKRWQIIVITTLCVLFSIVIALFITPQYQSSSNLSIPKLSQYQTLFQNQKKIMSKSVLFNRFVSKLASTDNLQSFLADNNANEQLTNGTSVKSEKSNKAAINSVATNYKINAQNSGKTVQLTTIASNPNLAVKNNIDYINYTNKKVLTELVSELKATANYKIKILELSIKKDIDEAESTKKNEIIRLSNQNSIKIAQVKNEIEQLKRQDLLSKQTQLRELENALQLAESLGLTNNNNTQKVSNPGMVIEVNNDTKDLYLKGSIYLKKEISLVKAKPHTLHYENNLAALEDKLTNLQNDEQIKALKNRVNNIPYIQGIEKKQAEIKQLKSLSYDINNVSSYVLENAPQLNYSPIKPKKRLIVIGGFALGLMLSFLLVIMQSNIIRHKETEPVLNDDMCLASNTI